MIGELINIITRIIPTVIIIIINILVFIVIIIIDIMSYMPTIPVDSDLMTNMQCDEEKLDAAHW